MKLDMYRTSWIPNQSRIVAGGELLRHVQKIPIHF